MNAATKPDPFSSLLAALRAVYEAEIERLADVYRTRILAGDFSGTDESKDEARFFRLQEEITKRHPWAKCGSLARAVLAVSPWAVDRRSTLGHGLEITFEGPELAEEAGECMARDVLGLAIERGWLRRGPRTNDEPAPATARAA
jgi:hypothetical protein